jgi:hypothetical protein
MSADSLGLNFWGQPPSFPLKVGALPWSVSWLTVSQTLNLPPACSSQRGWWLHSAPVRVCLQSIVGNLAWTFVQCAPVTVGDGSGPGPAVMHSPQATDTHCHSVSECHRESLVN